MDYVTFTEALRKQQVVQGMGDASSKLLAHFYRQQDWAIPSFDFGCELWHDAAREPLYLACEQWLLDGRFRLPFPECVFLEEFPEAYLLIRAMEQDDGSVVLQPYEKAKVGGPIHRIAYALAFGGEFGAWTKLPVGTLSTEVFLDVEEGSVLDPEHTQTWGSSLISRVSLAAFVLTIAKPNDECFIYASPETPALLSANRGRASAGLLPIPPTRTIKIRHEAIQRIAWKRQGHYSSKSPHARRGHERRYKNGKVVWIEATSIKGGGNIIPKRVVLEG